MDTRHEEYLRAQAGRGQELVMQMVRSLSSALVYPEAGNVATNEKLWDLYAAEWIPGAAWVRDMASGNRCADEDAADRNLACVGDEWAPHGDTQAVVDEWIVPYLGDAQSMAAAEIGSGGGRIARLVAPHVAGLRCFDVSDKMLAKAKASLEACPNVTFSHVHGDGPESEAGFDDKPRSYPTSSRAAYDFVYCFDVMVHMDLHAMFRCLKRIRALMKDDDSRAFISTANLLAPAGWARFERQSKYTVGGFYFVTPEAVRLLAAKAGFAVVRESTPQESNVYYDRDLMLVLKPVDLDAMATVTQIDP